MKKYKSNRGITLISLMIYIMLSLIVVAILATLTANFEKNIDSVNSRSST